MLVIHLSTVLLMTVIGQCRPYKTKRQYRMSFLGEWTVLATLDLLLLSSNPDLKVDQREGLGWALIGILGLYILVNQLLLFRSTIKGTCHWCKLRCIKGSQKKR